MGGNTRVNSLLMGGGRAKKYPPPPREETLHNKKRNTNEPRLYLYVSNRTASRESGRGGKCIREGGVLMAEGGP